MRSGSMTHNPRSLQQPALSKSDAEAFRRALVVPERVASAHQPEVVDQEESTSRRRHLRGVS